MIFDPRWTPKRPKTGPRWIQEGLECLLFVMLNFVPEFGPLWAPFWSLLGSLLGPQIGPKSGPKSNKNQTRPTYPHETAPRGSKSTPRGPKISPRGLKIAPGGPQDPPRRLPRGSKRDLRPHWTVPSDPKNFPRWSHEISFLSERICLVFQLHSPESFQEAVKKLRKFRKFK